MTDTATRTVLLVEDDPDLRAVLADVLRSLGVRVVTAADGYDALCMLDTFNIAVAVLDFWMPRFNGRQVMAYMRAVGLQTPVLMISGHPTGLAQPERIDADVYLRKPLDVSQFLAAVARLLPRAGAASGARAPLSPSASGVFPRVAEPDVETRRASNVP